MQLPREGVGAVDGISNQERSWNTWRASSPFGYAGESRCSGQPATVMRGPGQPEADATVGSIWRILEDSRRSRWLANRMAAVLPTRTSQNLVVLP